MKQDPKRIHRSRWEHEAISRLHTEGVRMIQIPYLRQLYDDARAGAGYPPSGPKEAIEKGFHQWTDSLVDRGYLANVRRDLYSNITLAKVPDAAEAAIFMRPTAVVSLLTVLGSGETAINNNSQEVFAVIASDSPDGTRPRTVTTKFRSKGAVKSAAWNFRFVAMSRSLYEAGRDEDRLDSAYGYPRATMERAFCDLLVANSNKKIGFKTLLRSEFDMTVLDEARLQRLVEAMAIESLFQAFLDDEPEEEPEQVSRFGI